MSDDQVDQPHESISTLPESGDAVAFSAAQQIEFTRKELRETLRDRRTIVTLLLMPLLLYPLLGFGLRLVVLQQTSDEEVEYRLAFETEEEARWLSDAVQTGDRLLAASNGSDEEPKIQILVPDDDSVVFDLESLVADAAVDLGIRIKLKQSFGSNQDATVQLYEKEGALLSRNAGDYVEKRLTAMNIELIKNWARQTEQQFSIPIQQTREQIKAEKKSSAILVLMPMVLLLMTVTGGVYPAIDLTAGERERNTMETLMALPVPRFRLLAAKYVAVVTVTMLTGLMNLLAMSMTLYAMQLDTLLLGESGFTFALAAKLFLTLSVFALFYSAVLLLLTSTARSFKEAQAYLIPLLLLSIGPGLVILMPGWKLEGVAAAIPLINVLLLSRDFLEGTVQTLPATVAIISTVMYGASVLSLAAKVFGNDAVAVGSRAQWNDLLQRPKEPSQLPTLSSTVCTLALLFPLYFMASGILARGAAQPSVRLVMSAVMTAGLFVGVPVALLVWQRVSLKRGLGLTPVAWQFCFAAALFGLAAWPWVFEIIVYAHNWGIRGVDPEKIENIESILAGWKQVPVWLMVLCLGILPGVCEEAFFRGFLFRGLKRDLNATTTIALSAIAFGLFHVVLSGGAAPERLLPSTLMGILLGWLTWRCASAVPAMILHAVHNSTLLMVVQSRDLLAEWNIGQVEQQHLPAWWLAISTVVLLIGAGLIRLLPRHHASTHA